MRIQQSDNLITPLIFKFVVDWVQHSLQHSPGIIWIDILLAIHFLLNHSCTVVGCVFILNNILQLLPGKSSSWADTLVLQKFIAMLDISQTSLWTH
jgi:hypothetical protein